MKGRSSARTRSGQGDADDDRAGADRERRGRTAPLPSSYFAAFRGRPRVLPAGAGAAGTSAAGVTPSMGAR
jgi:hypothetical protein